MVGKRNSSGKSGCGVRRSNWVGRRNGLGLKIRKRLVKMSEISSRDLKSLKNQEL